ncbi:MAG: hypothetical protein ACI4I9_02135 [Porcipelethomonas sp.]
MPGSYRHIQQCKKERQNVPIRSGLPTFRIYIHSRSYYSFPPSETYLMITVLLPAKEITVPKNNKE